MILCMNLQLSGQIILMKQGVAVGSRAGVDIPDWVFDFFFVCTSYFQQYRREVS